MLCDDPEGAGGRESVSGGVYIHIGLVHFAVQQKAIDITKQLYAKFLKYYANNSKFVTRVIFFLDYFIKEIKIFM